MPSMYGKKPSTTSDGMDRPPTKLLEDVVKLLAQDSKNLVNSSLHQSQTGIEISIMVATVQEVSRSVSHAADNTNHANEQADTGKQIITTATNAINNLATTV